MAYIPSPTDTGDIELGDALSELIEVLAEDVHEQWAKGRMDSGWQYGPERDDQKKLHPCLVPYGELPESEKEYDRNTAITTLKLIHKFGFTIKKEGE